MRRVFFLVLGFWIFKNASTIADDWGSYRGPNRNGVSREVEWTDRWPESGPKILWKAQIGIGFSSMTVADQRIFSCGNSDDVDSVFCLNAQTGDEIWKFSFPSPLDDRFFEGGPTSTPTVHDGSVYFLGRTGEMMSLKVEKGQVQWRKNLPDEIGVEVPGWGFAGSPIVVDKNLILSVGQSGTVLDKETGEVIWQSEGESGYTTPLIIPGSDPPTTIIASGKFFYGVELESGRVLWKQRWLTTFGCNAADPIFDRGRLFISSGYNRGSALLDLSQTPPTMIWETKDFQNQWSSSVLLDGYVYGVDGNDTGEQSLKCLELATGKIEWSFEGLGSASLIAANNRLIVLSEHGELIMAPVSSKGFVPTSRGSILIDKCWTAPVLANGLLYARSANGELVCVDLRHSK